MQKTRDVEKGNDALTQLFLEGHDPFEDPVRVARILRAYGETKLLDSAWHHGSPETSASDSIMFSAASVFYPFSKQDTKPIIPRRYEFYQV